MLNKIVYKKWSKIAKNEKNDQCAYINIFKRIVDMILIVFAQIHPLGYFSPNIMTPRPIQQKGLTFLSNCCLFCNFRPIFDLYKSEYQYLVNTVLLTRILENVFHALKMLQSRYHLVWTPRSKKNQFQRSFRGA